KICADSFLCFTSFCNNLISSSAVNSTLPPEVCINSNSDLIALNDAKATWSLAFIAVFSASCKSVCKLIAFVFLKFTNIKKPKLINSGFQCKYKSTSLRCHVKKNYLSVIEFRHYSLQNILKLESLLIHANLLPYAYMLALVQDH